MALLLGEYRFIYIRSAFFVRIKCLWFIRNACIFKFHYTAEEALSPPQTTPHHFSNLFFSNIWSCNANQCVAQTLPAFAAERRAARALSVGACSYLHLLPAWRSVANPPAAVAVVDRRDGRTDRRTRGRFIDPAPHTMRSSVNKHITCTLHSLYIPGGPKKTFRTFAWRYATE